jgi:hypothetical protein
MKGQASSFSRQMFDHLGPVLPAINRPADAELKLFPAGVYAYIRWYSEKRSQISIGFNTVDI